MSKTQALMNQRIEQAANRAKASKLLKTAIKYGVIKPGWSCLDYMFYAAKHHGWESTCISGPKGTLKSNLLLQHGYAIYKDMATVKKHFVTKRKQLLDLMSNAIEAEISIPWVGVDDIAVLFPKSLYFSHRKMYSELQSSWEASRTVINNFECTCVIKRKVASFILEDITGDIKCYNPVFLDHSEGSPTCIKSHYDYRRWLWLRNLKDPTEDIAKLITVEDIPFPATPDAFKFDPELKNGTFYAGGKEYKGEDFFRNHACLSGISTADFKEYWNDRLEIAKTGFRKFVDILEEAEKKPQRQLLSPEERSEKAKIGASARWKDHEKV